MRKILLFVVTLGITALVLETYLRYSRITPPTLKYYDQVFGSLNRPDIDYFKSVEGYFLGRTNYDGRFGEDYSERKADRRTLRILLIGDSFVEGIDVLSRNHFARSMEKILGGRLNRKVEILNFGRGNCTLHASSWYFVNHIVPNYDADVVLYFTEARDSYGYNDYPSTTYALDGADDSHLVAGYHWKTTPEYRLHQKLSAIPVLSHYDGSSFFRLLYRARAGIQVRGFPNITLGDFYGSRPEQDYRFLPNDSGAISPLTRKIYDLVYSYDKGQVVYVVRNMPMDARMLLAYMKSRDFMHLNLDELFDHYNIRGTETNAYYFRATKAYGGHWNNDGHTAVGTFLSNYILTDIDKFNLPSYEK